jgi:hypothetical protein
VTEPGGDHFLAYFEEGVGLRLPQLLWGCDARQGDEKAGCGDEGDTPVPAGEGRENDPSSGFFK